MLRLVGKESNPSKKSSGSSLGRTGREWGDVVIPYIIGGRRLAQRGIRHLGVCLSLFVPHVMFLCFKTPGRAGALTAELGEPVHITDFPGEMHFPREGTLAPSSSGWRPMRGGGWPRQKAR